MIEYISFDHNCTAIKSFFRYHFICFTKGQFLYREFIAFYTTMSISLENEQSELKERIPILVEELENAKIKTEGLQRFINKAKQITLLDARTPELVHEFIEEIVVSAPKTKAGKRYQEVEIHYNSVGVFRQLSPEEMEEAFQEHIKKKPHLTAKTA